MRPARVARASASGAEARATRSAAPADSMGERTVRIDRLVVTGFELPPSARKGFAAAFEAELERLLAAADAAPLRAGARAVVRAPLASPLRTDHEGDAAAASPESRLASALARTLYREALYRKVCR